MVLESQDLAAQLAELRAKIVGVAPVAEALGKIALHDHRLLGQRFQPPLVLGDRLERRLHCVISRLYLFIQLGKNTAIRQTATIKRIGRERRRIPDVDAQALQPVVRLPHLIADSAERIAQFLSRRSIAGRLRKLVADGGDAPQKLLQPVRQRLDRLRHRGDDPISLSEPVLPGVLPPLGK